MSGGSSIERRREDRTEIFLRVEYNEPSSLVTDYLTDVSNGGLFIRTEADFDVGQQIQFTLSFPGLLKPMHLEGIVRWRRAKSTEHPDRHPGVGVEFLFSNDDHRDEVRRALLRLRPDSAAAESPVQRFRVLLVEDNQFVHDLFRHALTKIPGLDGASSPIDLLSCTSAQEALHLLEEQQQIHLAIVDHFLPGMRGTDLIRTMRANDELNQIPILVVSVGGDGVRQEAFDAGADLYLDKPVLLKQLLATLQLILTTRGEAPNEP